MGNLSPSHQWDTLRHGMFLLTLAWARGTDISPRVRHGHRLFRRWAREAKASAEVEGKGHRPGLRGPRGVFTQLHHRRSPHIHQLLQGMFLLSRLWARVLFDSGASHSFIDASCVNVLGLKVESLENRYM